MMNDPIGYNRVGRWKITVVSGEFLFRLHVKINQAKDQRVADSEQSFMLFWLAYFCSLKMEVKNSSETSVELEAHVMSWQDTKFYS
jgi:hypothetical protein